MDKENYEELLIRHKMVAHANNPVIIRLLEKLRRSNGTLGDEEVRVPHLGDSA